MTYWPVTILRVAVNERLTINQGKYPVSGEFGFGVVGGKGAGLSHGNSSKDYSKHHAEDVLKRLMSNVVLWEGDLIGSETKHNSVQHVDQEVGETISKTVDNAVAEGSAGEGAKVTSTTSQASEETTDY